MMEAFDLATEIWWNEAERVTFLHTTELAQYRAGNPVPHLSEFMKGTF
jgi:hypothetical protein